jgi:hypothetical protein
MTLAPPPPQLTRRIVLGPCRCQGCGRPVVWTGTDWRTLPVESEHPERISFYPHRCRGTVAA